jgi:hypothetical protein
MGGEGRKGVSMDVRVDLETEFSGEEGEEEEG